MKDLTAQIAAEFAELGGDRRPDYEDRLAYRRGATDRSKFATTSLWREGANRRERIARAVHGLWCVRPREVCARLKEAPARSNTTEIAVALRDLGWRRVCFGQPKRYVWYAPNAPLVTARAVAQFVANRRETTAKAVCRGIGVPPDLGHCRRVAAYLRVLGWVSKQRGAKRVQTWCAAC
jgi:hypothetical protein